SRGAGNRRSGELPGALCAASCMDRLRQLQCRHRVPPGGRAAAHARGRAARAPDRVESRRHPEEDGARDPGGARAGVVGAPLEEIRKADLELARLCAEGDEPAWERFVREYRPLLYRAADALDPTGGARDIADSLYAELYGLAT